MVRRTFLVRQATKIASAPGYSCGLRREKSRVELRVTSWGRIIADKTAIGTNRKARRNQPGTFSLWSRRMNERRVPNVSRPATRMRSQILMQVVLPAKDR